MANTLENRSRIQLSSIAVGLQNKTGLLFKDAFSGNAISNTLTRHVPEFRERIYTPLVTLFAWLGQVLSPDRSCADAVARVNADRVAAGETPGSADTGGFCKARDRLPLGLLIELCKGVAEGMERAVPANWLWRGRAVKVVDGSTITVADTPENQAEYPQTRSQKEGVGFPILRLVVVFSLLTGCALGMAQGPYRGKQTGEHALLRQLFGCFKAGDVAIGDAYFSAYFLIAILSCLGVDCVFATHGARFVDFRTGQRLGKKDHRVIWEKPQRPDWMDQQTYNTMPATIKVRECEIDIGVPGFRSEKLVLVTTLLHPRSYPRHEIGALYSRRWSAEVNLNAIKTTLQMAHLRAKTPEMVRKEIWATLLAYNLIRKLLAEAAFRYDRRPEELSFKGAVQTLNAYRPLWVTPGALPNAERVFDFLLAAIATRRVGTRPGRVEPRAIKRRPKPYPRMSAPRVEARAAILH